MYPQNIREIALQQAEAFLAGDYPTEDFWNDAAFFTRLELATAFLSGIFSKAYED